MASSYRRVEKHALLETGKQIIPPNIDELTARYQAINVPTLIIWGKQDKIINPIVGDLLDQAIPNSTLKWIDQCGHVPQEEMPEATVLVLDFLVRIIGDVWMVERRSSLSFLHKAPHALLFQSNIGRKNLQRDLAIQFRVLREINFAHPARAELRDDFVRAKFCA